MSKTSGGVELARRHLAAGRFGDALRAAQSEASLDSPEQCLVLAEARWRVGNSAHRRSALDRCARRCRLARRPQGRVRYAPTSLSEEGRFKEAIGLFNRCIEYAEASHDLPQLCRAQLALFAVLLNQHGSQACESLATEVRRNVIRSGEPFLFGWLHRIFAEFEARAGNSSRAFQAPRGRLSDRCSQSEPLAARLAVDRSILGRRAKWIGFRCVAKCQEGARVFKALWS